MISVQVASNHSRYGQDISIRHLHLAADEPPALGGDDVGPTPTELILAGLGSCKAITLQMYAERKGWKLESVAVELSYDPDVQQPTLQAKLILEGDLDEQQRQRLRDISDRCPVHKLLTHPVAIQTQLA
ncbi:OsmC family protein [Acaryochloris sp. 'Moss Beach']|uniref:OsmC family protein n=1 Tax=Acaryochloris sp. 'Moss Beach' TaxID=2740837 RepID=UPI001F18AE84|nr:OsmC family protein [Acaryochloris sp. 'Moss Beach']UJB71104.1 OsmC family protein [Acaryochloris sp. 'Moss Beach']